MPLLADRQRRNRSHPHGPAERGYPLTARRGHVVTHVHEPGRPGQRVGRRARRVVHVHEAAHVPVRRQLSARRLIRHQPAPRVPGPGPVQQPVAQHHPLRRLPHGTLQRRHPLHRTQPAPLGPQIQRHVLGGRNLTGLVSPRDALRHHPPNPRRQRRVHQIAGPGDPHLGVGPEVPALQVGELVHHHVGRGQRHRPPHPVRVEHVAPHGLGTQAPQPAGVGVPPHEPGHRVPPVNQQRRQTPPDNPRRPGQENPHH
jgi:hypothetical protein